MKRIVATALILLLVLAVLFFALARGWFGSHEGPGQIEGAQLPGSVLKERAVRQADAASAHGFESAKQILFGDLHVHTTVSMDAFNMSLPAAQGEGAHPQADACDFARYCSALDFWSINDHAEAMTPRVWKETVDSIRQCNAISGDPANPDVVAFLGWEWSQVGATPEEHYGHKNVVLRDLEDGKIPTRPIASGGIAADVLRGGAVPSSVRAIMSLAGRHTRYLDYARYLQERAEVTVCEDGISSPELPDTCVEDAITPEALFRKLDEWGHDALVIPHGTTWGMYTPPGSDWRRQLTPAGHDADRQRLVEIFSGHGNSEEYRAWRAVGNAYTHEPTCPEPTASYLPACWQAGEIVRSRCDAEGLDEAKCESRVVEARAITAAAGVAYHLAVPGAQPDEWLDAGQCRDCYLPAFGYRPASSVQYILALGTDDPVSQRFRFGFLGSSDTHTARPGTGYKEVHRRAMTDAGLNNFAQRADRLPDRDPLARAELLEQVMEPVPTLRTPAGQIIQGFDITENERSSSFFFTGGLVATHSEGRDRGAIWDALTRREVYGTSGDRILLWFDLLDADSGESWPMGSEVVRSAEPSFRVRATGAFEQRPGCPDVPLDALSPERIERLCRGECYNPSDVRKPVDRIEVVRIRPQLNASEPVEELIEDPWRTFACPGTAHCEVVFTDPEFESAGRETVYYVRALQAPTPTINGDPIGCTRDADGNCIEVNRCSGFSDNTPYEEDCLSHTAERAWSSPIFVDYDAGE